MPPKKLKKGGLSTKKGAKGKKKEAVVPPPPPPPPPDPRQLLVDELIPRYGLSTQPPDPLQACAGFEGEIPAYSCPEVYSYKTCRGVTIQSPYFTVLNPSSEIYVPIKSLQVDWQGVRRCWNALRLHFEPVFAQQQPEFKTIKEYRHLMLDMYSFLRARGEVFLGGFPADEVKWQPLWELLRLTFYVEGDDPAVAICYAKRKGRGGGGGGGGGDIDAAEGLASRFWKALAAGDLGVVAEALHQQPQLVNLPRPDEHFPLTCAAEKGDLQMLRLLLAAGSALANAPARQGETALHHACERNDVEMVHLLLCYGADATVQNIYGETPLHYAAARGNDTVVHLLCRQCKNLANVLPTFRAQTTPLHLASARGHVEVIKRLIEYKADTAARDAWGLTPLLVAGGSGKAEGSMAIALADPATMEILNKKKKGAGAKKGAKGRSKRK